MLIMIDNAVLYQIWLILLQILKREIYVTEFVK